MATPGGRAGRADHGLHAAVSQALGGERNVRVLDRVAEGDLAEAVAALTAWCADRLTVAPAFLPEPSSPLACRCRVRRSLASQGPRP